MNELAKPKLPSAKFLNIDTPVFVRILNKIEDCGIFKGHFAILETANRIAKFARFLLLERNTPYFSHIWAHIGGITDRERDGPKFYGLTRIIYGLIK